MKKHKQTLEYNQYETPEALPETDRRYIALARQAARQAYAPYSGFQVGAVAVLADGSAYTGNNQENAAYPSGQCAERVALFYANAQKPDVAVLTLYIVAEKQGELINEPVTPCGSCRQVILESSLRFGQAIRLVLAGQQAIYEIPEATQMLPLSFQREFLA